MLRMKSQKQSKGIKIKIEDNKITIDVYVILKFNVIITTVVETLRNDIKYNIESSTGLIVDCANITIKSIKS